ncbi:hypothetical protein CW304_08740 [Bacillus sp. UFRGS-B20]|nr:hypothetical protein CW304_08740 [Bacillus sp. UFRGS-B20]
MFFRYFELFHLKNVSLLFGILLPATGKILRLQSKSKFCILSFCLPLVKHDLTDQNLSKKFRHPIQ